MKRRIFQSAAVRAAIACIVLLLAFGIVFAQYQGNPVKKDKLLNVLRSKQLQTREIVRVIKSNGVDFAMTPAVESELVAAGARPEVIEAARDNYRQPAIAANKGGKSTPTPAPATRFSGKPLDKDAIVTLLENGVADTQVRKNVEGRGVSFKSTAAIKAEIKKAGGSVALLNLIDASFVDPNQNAASNNVAQTTVGASDDYDEMINRAVDQYDNQKATPAALETLQKAIKSNPKEARAYQLLGFMTLYGQKNFEEAEKWMREAINHGGSAVFRVFHDHDGVFKTTCQGSLYIASDSVHFESDDNKHTFETSDASIKEVKMNSVFKAFYKLKSGSFKFVLKSGEKDSVKFGFAPLTDNALESKMIIRLIGKND